VFSPGTMEGTGAEREYCNDLDLDVQEINLSQCHFVHKVPRGLFWSRNWASVVRGPKSDTRTFFNYNLHGCSLRNLGTAKGFIYVI
jgi:hypothetical protein